MTHAKKLPDEDEEFDKLLDELPLDDELDELPLDDELDELPLDDELDELPEDDELDELPEDDELLDDKNVQFSQDPTHGPETIFCLERSICDSLIQYTKVNLYRHIGKKHERNNGKVWR